MAHWQPTAASNAAKIQVSGDQKIVMTDKVPYCDRCRGLIKPDVIFFGEMLDQDLLERGRRDFNEATSKCGRWQLDRSTRSKPAIAGNQNHSKLVIVNSQPTPYDQFATLLFQDLKQVFDAINRKWT